MKNLLLKIALITAALTGSMLAQELATPPPGPPSKPPQDSPLSVYKFDFVLRELQDGKPINSRNYSMTVENRGRGNLRTGARVPVTSTDKGLQYMDIGVNIDCGNVRAREENVSFNTSIEISSFALPEQSPTSGTPPVLRNMRAQMDASVPVGKPTLIGIIDDANSTKRYEIAVTATKLK
jgi:hypothetical protein